jgi:hypothetical protein
MVVIVDADQISQLEMSGNARRLTGNAFLSTPISEEAVCVVVGQFKPRFVEYSCGMGLCNG